MYTVATIASFGLSVPIGPAKNINRLYNDKGIFINNDIKLLGPFCPDLGYVDYSTYQGTRKHNVREHVKASLRKTTIGNWILYRSTHVRRAKQAVEAFMDTSENNPNLIVFRDFTTAWEYIKKDGDSPYILVMHNDGTNDMFFSASAYPKLSRGISRQIIDGRFDKVISSAAGILFLSEKAIQVFRDRYPSINCPMSWYHQGVEIPDSPSPFDKPESTVVFVTVGTVCRRKNQAMIITAFSKLNNKNTILYIVGDGPELDYCKSLCEKLDISNRVYFTGSLEHPGNVLKAADVYVSASLDEGVPNAAVEGMSFGLPLILTDVGSCSELIEDNGVLINVNEDDLKCAMEEVASNSGLRLKYSKNSSNLYKRLFTTEQMCLEHAAFYLSVLNNLAS